MSEDFNQLPGEPEQPGQPPAAPQESGHQQAFESIVPEQPMMPQYPPSPEFYAHMPVVESAQAPAAGVPFQAPAQGTPGFPPPMPGAPVFAPPPGYGYPPPGYGFEPVPPAQPLPLGQAIRGLPGQYKKILFKPGVRSFSEEQGKADWGIIWIQLLFLMIVQAVVSIPLFLAYNHAFSASGSADMSVFSSPAFFVLEIILEVIFVPAGFFITVGLQYMIARAFKGLGNFKTQAYNQLLFQVPMGVVSSLLSIILSTYVGNSLANSLSILSASSSGTPTYTTTTPTTSGPLLLLLLVFDLCSLAISVYSIVLNVFSIMAAQRMTGGRATASVLIPYGIFILLGLLFFCAAFVFIAAAAASTAHP